MGDPQRVVLRTYTVYSLGGGFVAVEFEVNRDGVCEPIREVGRGATLAEVRAELARVAPWADACVTRSDVDAEDIVETWI